MDRKQLKNLYNYLEKMGFVFIGIFIGGLLEATKVKYLGLVIGTFGVIGIQVGLSYVNYLYLTKKGKNNGKKITETN